MFFRWAGTKVRSWVIILSKNQVNLSKGSPHADTIGRRGMSGLWLLGRPYSSAVRDEVGLMAFIILSGIFPVRVCEMMFLVAASSRGVGFLVISSYCDVIVSAFFM